MQHPFHLMPDMMVGPFRIQARLGAGGFGAVFRAECGGELYALKFAAHGPDSEDPNLTDARAERELACLLLIRHPNVVRVWAHGRWPHPRTGHHYVVMDYVDGPTLLEWARSKRPPLRQVVRVFDTLALALDALHTEGLHHRDLKGANILVRERDGEPVLVDFGAAEHTAVDAPLTEGPLPPGTPHLRTPEAVRFHREQYADPHARYRFQPSDDLYALGCTLYEALTSAPPFPPTLPREVLTSLIEKEMPPSPAVLNPQVPAALAELVLRLLAKRPEERPESGRALHEQFQTLLRDEAPTLDMPLSPGANAATTEGMGGPAVMSSADNPERPLSGPADWGGARASALSTSQSEARAPTEPAERASPGSPSPRRRPWVAATAVLVLLAVLLLTLWGGGPLTPSSSGEHITALSEAPAPVTEAVLLPDSESSRTPRLEDTDSALPLASSHGDAGPPDTSSFSLDAGSPALAEALPSSTQPKGPHMRTKPPATPPPVPPEPERPRRSGSSMAGPLVGVVAACALAGGCATSEPAVRLGPPPLQPCPPGSDEVMEKELGIDGPTLNSVWMPGATDDDDYFTPVVVTEGRHEVLVRLKKWGSKVPRGSAVVGDFFLRDRLYGRFTELRLPDGRRFPFCGYLVAPKDGGKKGAPFLPGSTPGSQKVAAIQEVVTSIDEH